MKMGNGTDGYQKIGSRKKLEGIMLRKYLGIAYLVGKK